MVRIFAYVNLAVLALGVVSRAFDAAYRAARSIAGVPPELDKATHRVPIAAGTSHAVMDFDVENPGGSTSGNFIVFRVVAKAADSVELSGMTLTQLQPYGISPFQIFH